ncbi:hypothetical protein EUGRSUZ_G00468 [Eucalyptus grandis]|uniref:Uncharacterized protein n=1 Tax=Eucalyptus grandis TaxID=71139 RepID=A0ACC3K484_EUCGR|nr:hypothetical protein EUGRSUZ_G00468 [Eucalyptus grandis]
MILYFGVVLSYRKSPGNVHYVLGGVARNIADCMSKQGRKPFSISAVGLDMAGQYSTPFDSEKSCPPESLIKILKPAIVLVLEKGIKIVVVTIGAQGVFLCSKEGSILTRAFVEKPQWLGINSELNKLISSDCHSHKFHDARHIEGTSHLFALHLPGLPSSVKKLTGAGHCLVGATLASICEGLNIIQAISVSIAAAKATVEADSNVPLTFDLIGVADACKDPLTFLSASEFCG